MTKNKLAYFLPCGSPYNCKLSFLSAIVSVGLWLKFIGLFSLRDVGPTGRWLCALERSRAESRESDQRARVREKKPNPHIA